MTSVMSIRTGHLWSMNLTERSAAAALSTGAADVTVGSQAAAHGSSGLPICRPDESLRSI